MNPNIYGPNAYGANNKNEKNVMVISPEYAAPAHPVPVYQELECEYAVPTTKSGSSATPSPYGYTALDTRDSSYYDTPIDSSEKQLTVPLEQLYAKVNKVNK